MLYSLVCRFFRLRYFYVSLSHVSDVTLLLPCTSIRPLSVDDPGLALGLHLAGIGS